MKFKAVLFDIDGTLTNLGERGIPADLEAKLNELIDRGIPVAVCSGRHHPDSIVNRLGNIQPEKWILIAENGSVGYHFKEGEWKEFYRVPWPKNSIPKDELAEILQSKMAFSKFFNNPSTLIMRPGEALEVSLAELERLCDLYQLEIEKIFKERGETGLNINNSKIGIIINPSGGDKDCGIIEYAKYLGIENDKEILCIGDQPSEGDNDQYFLNGKHGTPYSVGEEAGNASTVEDENGNTLYGPAGTLRILNSFYGII
ncbi:MAG: HAD hydrolase family protein [Patescibacteria group bacterium]